MWRRAVREVVLVEVVEEEEGFGGAPLGIEVLFGWSVVMVLESGSMHQTVALLLSSTVINVELKGGWSRERADLPRYLSAL